MNSIKRDTVIIFSANLGLSLFLLIFKKYQESRAEMKGMAEVDKAARTVLCM